jgi:HD-GYP domain-containing protein (c-di-GMP phosphodiesterase class II)
VRRPASIPILEADATSKLNLIYELSEKIGSAPHLPVLLEQIIEMTQKALKASAASILLFKDGSQELFFEAASGPVGKVLKSFKVDTQNSIAGEVIRNGKPLIVNDVTKNANFGGNVDGTTGFITRSMIATPLTTRQKTIGVLEVLNKLDGTDFDESDIHVLVPVALTAAMAIENTRLHQTILEAYENTVTTLVGVIDAKDPYTRGHSQRVMKYALIAGTALELPPDQMEVLKYASIFHDVGKIAVDCQILNKPEKLTPAEWNIIREHPAIGSNLMSKIPFLEKMSRGVMYHHERYDGAGYPAGLKGEDIPFEARIIAVADSFDTMTTDRSYRSAYSIEYALEDVRKETGKQFCPVAAQAFISGFTGQIQ